MLPITAAAMGRMSERDLFLAHGIEPDAADIVALYPPATGEPVSSPANARRALQVASALTRPLPVVLTEPVPGPALGLLRTALGVEPRDVAVELQVSKQRVSTMERAGATAASATRFRDAVLAIAARS